MWARRSGGRAGQRVGFLGISGAVVIHLLHALPGTELRVAAASIRHRLGRVLRLDAGAALVLCDGQGGTQPVRWTGHGFEPTGPVETAPAPDPQIALGVALLKGPRFDWMVEKATECGAARLTPLLLDHGVVRERAGAERAQRWQALADAATEQCGRRYRALVAAPTTLESWLAEQGPGDVLVCDERPGGQPLHVAAAGRSGRIALLVGPEGALSESERCRVADLVHVTLGPHVLRAETAAIAAVAIVRIASIPRDSARLDTPL
ncbi:MAG: 16S rRNA (uracil(1498)-N(3))-methyltransferase [Myxococcales bacterium]|nr:16S rRNA (uracil(1498)-N(3))-methyltransferase [Myxococcales bacterium]